MARLTLSFSDIYTRVSEFLALGSSPAGTDLTKVKDITYRGLRQFYYPTYIDPKTRKPKSYLWSFLTKHYSFITVNNMWKYSLPADFSEMLTDISFDPGEGYTPLRERTLKQIIELRVASDSDGVPEFYAIAPVTFDDATGTFYELWIYPDPQGTHSLQFFYKIDPLKPEDTTDYFPGGVRAIEAILENCLAIAEQQEDDVVGIHTQLANELTQKLILHDRKPHTDKLGNLHHGIRAFPPPRRNYTTFDIDDDAIYS